MDGKDHELEGFIEALVDTLRGEARPRGKMPGLTELHVDREAGWVTLVFDEGTSEFIIEVRRVAC